jgi:seryl-tRNA synthetase
MEINKKLNEMQMAMLQILLQSNITKIENKNLIIKEEVEQKKNQIKELELKQLQDLIAVRDSVINQTKKQLTLNKMTISYEEDALESTDLIMKRMRMSFPNLPASSISPIKGQDKNILKNVNVKIESSLDREDIDQNKSGNSKTFKPKPSKYKSTQNLK